MSLNACHAGDGDGDHCAVDMSVMLALALVMVRRSAAMLSVIFRVGAMTLACSTTTNNMIHA